jgi:hypothetical protein
VAVPLLPSSFFSSAGAGLDVARERELGTKSDTVLLSESFLSSYGSSEQQRLSAHLRTCQPTTVTDVPPLARADTTTTASTTTAANVAAAHRSLLMCATSGNNARTRARLDHSRERYLAHVMNVLLASTPTRGEPLFAWGNGRFNTVRRHRTSPHSALRKYISRRFTMVIVDEVSGDGREAEWFSA